MKPTIGRIVIYSTTELDQRRINEHPFNTPREKSPAIVVAINEDETINLKVFIDGWGEIYAKNVSQGDEPGQWDWPVVIPPTKEKLLESLSNANPAFVGDSDAMSDLTFIPAANIEHPITEQLAKKLEAEMENPPVPHIEEEETKEVTGRIETTETFETTETTTTEVDETKAAIEQLEEQPEAETTKAAKASKTTKAGK